MLLTLFQNNSIVALTASASEAASAAASTDATIVSGTTYNDGYSDSAAATETPSALVLWNSAATDAASSSTGQDGAPTYPVSANDPASNPAISVLMHFDGTDGSTTFTDSSASGTTWNATGTPTISAAQSKFGGTSLSLPGTSYLRSNGTTPFDISSGDFTVEGWFYRTVNSTAPLFNHSPTGNANGYTCFISSAAGSINFQFYGSTATSGGAILGLNAWTHIAIVGSGTTITIYVDGVSKGSSTQSTRVASTGTFFSLGTNVSASTPFTGYIDDFCITKGVAKYTANFTPPTAPIVAGAVDTGDGTAIVPIYEAASALDSAWTVEAVSLSESASATESEDCLYSANASIAEARTATSAQNSGPIFVAYSCDELTDPYWSSVVSLRLFDSPTIESGPIARTWTAGTSSSVSHNGANSLYVFSTSNSSQTPVTSDWYLSGDFTIECWVYQSVMGAPVNIITAGAFGTNGYVLSVIPNTPTTGQNRLQFSFVGGSYITANSSIPTSVWTHIAVSRVGSIMYMHIGGVFDASAAFTLGSTPSGQVTVGGGAIGAIFYEDDLRVTVGVSRYSNTDISLRPYFPSAPTVLESSSSLAQFVSDVSDPASGADSTDAYGDLYADLTDPASGTETSDGFNSATNNGAVTEPTAGTEFSSTTYGAGGTLTEPATATESPSSAMTTPQSASEAASGTDAPSSVMTTTQDTTEATSSLEITSGVAGFAGVSTEPGSALDTSLSGTQQNSTTTEPVSASDLASAIGIFLSDTAEAASAQSAQSVIYQAVASLIESASATDNSATTALFVTLLVEATAPTTDQSGYLLFSTTLAEAAVAVALANGGILATTPGLVVRVLAGNYAVAAPVMPSVAAAVAGTRLTVVPFSPVSVTVPAGAFAVSVPKVAYTLVIPAGGVGAVAVS